jgi:type IV secretion system protein TrbL
MSPDPGILTTLLNSFLTVFSAGPGHLAPAAARLLFLMAGIELTLAGIWWVLKGENVLVGLIQKTLLLCLFSFFVANWTTLINTVLDGFVWAGFTAGGSSSAAGAALIKDPSAIISQAFVTIQPIEERINGLSGFQIGSLFMYGWAFIFTLIAFFMLAIQVFITYLEFYLVAALSLVLVPFGVFKHTAFIAERAFGSVVSFGVKLMVLSFIIAAAEPVLAQITLPAVPTLQQAYMVLLAALAIAFLAWHAPGIAAGMISGGPSLTAGSAAGFVASSTLGALAGAAAASSAARTTVAGALSATKAAASGFGTVRMGAQLGAASAQLGGSGALGQAGAAASGGATALGRSTAEAAFRPIRAVGTSIAEAHRRGEVRAWKPQAAKTAASASATSPTSAVHDIQAAMRAANTVRSVIPPEGGGGAGMSVPIRPTE